MTRPRLSVSTAVPVTRLAPWRAAARSRLPRIARPSIRAAPPIHTALSSPASGGNSSRGLPGGSTEISPISGWSGTWERT